MLDKNRKYREIEQKVDAIVRNEKYSDYEKKLHIMEDVIWELLREIEDLEKDKLIDPFYMI